MKRVKNGRITAACIATIFSIVLPFATINNTLAQSTGSPAVSARPVTILVTIRVKGGVPPESEMRQVDFAISEDGDPQTILSISAMGTNSPINLLVLIHDDVESTVALE